MCTTMRSREVSRLPQRSDADLNALQRRPHLALDYADLNSLSTTATSTLSSTTTSTLSTTAFSMLSTTPPSLLSTTPPAKNGRS